MSGQRDYTNREPSFGLPFGFRWSATTVLMVALVIVFAVQCVDDVHLGSGIQTWLALTREGLQSGWIWQLLTFQFLHGDILHLLFNLIGLYFFGNFVENVLGTRRFLVAYFGCGVAGGLLQGTLMLGFPNHFGSVMFGASAGVSGAFAIFAMLQRESEVRLYFLIPVRAMTLLAIFAAIALFFTVVPSPRGGGAAHAAHLGGLLAGCAWVRLGWHRDFVTLPWEEAIARLRRWRPLEGRRRKRLLVRAAAVHGGTWRSAARDQVPDLPPEEFISREVDPILDKISAQGIHSLTERERRILEAARSKMAKR